jgi:hypothetical protein
MSTIFESVIRADDFLFCQFEFVNLVLRTSDTGVQRLERAAPGPAFIVIRLPPQNIAEQVVQGDSTPDFPYKGGLAGPSRLTCRLPETVPHVDYRLDALLAQLATAELVPETATEGPVSVIEFPDRLLLVPQPSTRLVHRTKPITSTSTGVTEIWHTTLRGPAGGTSPQFKAIENPKDTAASQRPFASSLTKPNRDDIIKHCRLSTRDKHVIGSTLFRLAALGATARLKGNWAPDPNVSLAAWEHQAELGRDHYAYTLEQGYLFPFGHRATIATVTERKLASHLLVRVAELAQTKTLTILDAERSYNNLENVYPGRGREMPFVQVRVASAPRRIEDNAAPIRVDLVLTDRAGNLIDCSATVFFVPVGAAATDPASLAALKLRYAALSVVALGGQRVAMTGDDDGGGDTSLNVDALTFGVKLPSELQARVDPGFLPFMLAADAKIPGLEQMVGTAAGATPAAQRRPTTIEFHPTYLANGFVPGDSKQVFAKFAAIPGITIPPARAGGLAAPKFPAMNGLSRLTGPVADVEGFVKGTPPLKAKDLVGDTKLLGLIPLSEIIEDVTGADSFPLGNVRDLFNKVNDVGQAFLPRPVMTSIAGPLGVESRFVWKPKIRNSLPAPLRKLDNMELILRGRITTSARSASSPPAFKVVGTLRNFELSFDLLGIGFKSLEFISETGRKVEITLDLGRIDFRGTLGFVRKLQEALPTGSLARGASIQMQPDGVVARYAIPLPSIPLGALSIQNIAVSTSISLPFVEGKPASVRFALSERNNPFQVTVSIFGGTGFFAIEAFTDKSVRVEAALEFGGIAALNLVVVKGGVYLLAGVYLSIKSDGGLLIEGHLRLGGFVDVLGLVSVSIEVYIALTYVEARKALYGTGRLTVGVKLLFFSESFSFEIEKEIAAFGEAPTTTTLTALAPAAEMDAATVAAAPRAPEMTAGQWETYCGAFA